jgi:Flp pilus assembly protein TadG
MRPRTWPRLRRWRADDSGTTAVELALVALPFVMLVFGIMTICVYFFTNFSLENAAWQAARAIRTGQLQQGQGSYAGATTSAQQKAAFVTALCSRVPTFLQCASKIVTIVQSNTSFAGISKPSCATNGTMITQTAAAFDAGSSNSVVLITVCYPWSFANKLPFIKLGNLSDGSMLMQASVSIRTEPYN